MAGIDNAKVPFSVQGYLDTLAKKPGDVPARTALIKQNVTDMQSKLNVSPTEAGNAVRTTMSLYAYSKGIDPASVLQALSTDEQAILNYSASENKVYGMSIPTALKMGQLATGISGIFLVISIGCFAVALFTVGPEIAAAIAGAGGVVEAMGLVTGSAVIQVGGMAFVLSQFFGHFGSEVPLYTKQAIDNGSIGPGLRISALKQAQDLQDQLSGTKAPGGLTSAQFSTLASSLEAQGVTGINDPFIRQTIIYTRKALATLLNEIYGDLILKGEKTTPSKLTPQVAQYLIVPGKAIASIPQSATVSAPTSSVASTKIFTGVVSQGVLGSATSFTARPDDLVNSLDDLRQAVQNNVAPFIASIGSKIIYEVKIQSSVTQGNGIVLHGTAVQVPSGVTAGGIQKYKTVVNKFAVLNLYILTDKGTKTKITSINLGPTDAVNFKPQQFELDDLQTTIQSTLFTSNPAEITSVATNKAPQSPTTSVNVTQVVTPIKTPGLFRQTGDFGSALFARVGNRIYQTNLLDVATFPQIQGVSGAGTQAGIVLPILKTQYGLDFNTLPVVNVADLYNDRTIIAVGKAGPEGGPDPIVQVVSFKDFLALRDTSNPETAKIILAKSAGTLSEFYGIQGLAVPPLDIRGQQYESLGLGNKTTYVGSAEQNTKLLSALQAQI